MTKHKKQTNKQTLNGSIRIIGGKHRGRKLPVLLAEGLRPTTDRVKETVFNWLMPYIHNSVCLDCFAGSGGLGFEAFSRGADFVTLLELNKKAAAQLNQNKTLLHADNITIKNVDTFTYLIDPQQTFDLVFIDPPFRHQLVQQCANLLNQGWLNDNAIIYVEMEADHQNQQLPKNWQLLKEKVAGQVVYQLYQYNAE